MFRQATIVGMWTFLSFVQQIHAQFREPLLQSENNIRMTEKEEASTTTIGSDNFAMVSISIGVVVVLALMMTVIVLARNRAKGAFHGSQLMDRTHLHEEHSYIEQQN